MAAPRNERGSPEPVGDRAHDTEDPRAVDAALVRARVLARMFDEPEPRPKIDRFELLEEIGRGGMGRVYLAHDPELDRKVALKVVAADGEVAAARMLREARGLAQIAHPNVIPVFEVGRAAVGIWIAMEHVAGQTLRVWVRDHHPSREEILRHYVAAGRGLAAVHAAGLIHRDVKPSNLLLGDDGRARVIDFGLVRDVLATDSSTSDNAVSSAGMSSSTDDAVTGSSFVGTPAYAAPEQLLGKTIGPATDQYGLCVSLWEALYGTRPPRGAGHAGLASPVASVLPRRIHAALCRGLSRSPADRFPSVDALLEELERRPPSRSRVAAIGLGVVAAAGVTAWLASSSTTAPPPRPCDEVTLALDELWNSRAREAIGSHALVAELDSWTSRWRESSVIACRDTRIRQTTNERVLAARDRCLSTQLDHLAALLSALGDDHGGSSPLPSGLRLASVLDDPGQCLRERPEDEGDDALATEQIAAIDSFESRLFGIRLDAEAGRHANALAALDALSHSAAPLLSQWSSGRLRLALTRGELLLRAGRTVPARATLEHAVELAIGAGQPEQEALAWSLLTRVALYLEFDVEAARRASRRASARVADREIDPALRARLLANEAEVERLGGNLKRAQSLAERAIEVAKQAQVGAWIRARYVRQLGLVLARRGLQDQAEQRLAEAQELEGSERHGDELALDRATALTQEGIVALGGGDLRLAESALREAIEHYDEHRGELSLGGARARVALADLWLRRGRLADARREADLAEQIVTRLQGPGHRLRGEALSARGSVAFAEGEFAEATECFDRSLTILEVNDADSVSLGAGHSNLAEALVALGRRDDARDHLDRAFAAFEAELPDDHPYLAFPHKILGSLHAEAGEDGSARHHLRAALAIHEATGANAPEQAALHLALARSEARCGALATAATERATARALYEQVTDQEAIARLDAWSPADEPVHPCHDPTPRSTP